MIWNILRKWSLYNIKLILFADRNKNILSAKYNSDKALQLKVHFY